MDAPPLRWGVLGPGWIADQMVGSLHANTRQQVVAVGSREVCRAQDFADRHGIARAHGSYEELVADPLVDIVYVASPHSGHREHALLALEAGKHVLIEKAFARNAAEAHEIVASARSRGLFCMEAMWTRFLPGTDVTIMGAAPMGDPLDIQIRGCRFSIRKAEADAVGVEPA